VNLLSIDAARAYKQYIEAGGKMFVTISGAMGTAGIVLSLSGMIRQGKRIR
jgi:deoxyhypusine synthase